MGVAASRVFGRPFFFPQEPEEAFVMEHFRPLRYALLLLLLILTPLAIATEYPFTVVDDLGNSVTLDREPQRVIAMIPSHTELVCALAACDRLVAVDDFSNYPASVTELPHLGSAFAPNIEALVALEPDLVLVDESSGLAAALAPLGLPVYAGTAQTLDEVFTTFETIGAMLNRESEAALLSGEVRGTIAGVALLVAGRDTVEVYYELDSSPYSVGPGSFIGDLLARAGGVTIVPADFGDFPLLDPEFVVAADPELILLADAPFGESLATLRERPGWGGLSAVVAGAVIELTQPQVDSLNRPGPRIGEAVRLLAELLHPGLF
jgi:iron complex transport system substrate-binding protein